MFMYYEDHERRVVRDSFRDIVISKICYYDERKREDFFNLKLSLYEAIKFYIHQFKTRRTDEIMLLDETINKYLYKYDAIPQKIFEYMKKYISKAKNTITPNEMKLRGYDGYFDLDDIDVEYACDLCLFDNMSDVTELFTESNILCTTIRDLIKYTGACRIYYEDFLNIYNEHDKKLMKEFSWVIQNLEDYYGNYELIELAQTLFDKRDQVRLESCVDDYADGIIEAMLDNCDENCLFLYLKCDAPVNEYNYIIKSLYYMTEIEFNKSSDELFIVIKEEGFGYKFVHVILYYFILKAYLEKGYVKIAKKN